MALFPVQKISSTGEDVRTVQYLLNAHGAGIVVDGNFGPKTDAAVKAFQSSHGLEPDGIVGDVTWPALLVTVSAGSTGDAVRAVQSQVRSRLESFPVDGTFGSQTDEVVRGFQGPLGLLVDGIVGPKTWPALINKGLGATSSSKAAERMFTAWTMADKAAAARNSTVAAANALFARTWSATDGWTFDGCQGAAGHLHCSWSRPGATLGLSVNNNVGAPFFFVDGVTFQP